MFVTLCCEVLPPHVTGYISRFLTEVNTGVYVGRVTSRIAENLWERCCEAACNGRLTMIASSNEREQGFIVKTLNSGKLELIDFDGLVLIEKPSLVTGNREKSDFRC